MHNSTMFALPCLTVVFLAILQASSGDFPSPFSANFEKERNFRVARPVTRPHHSSNPNLLPQCVHQSILTSPKYPHSGSIFANVPSVTLFANTFLDAVATTDILREVFDLSQTTPKQYGDFLRQFVETFYVARGVKNAAAIGEFVTRAIKQYFDILTWPIVARIFCNSAANFLFVNGDLGLHNAEDLALAYVQAIVDSAKVTMNSNPTSKFAALGDGYVNFFDSLEHMTKINRPMASYYFGNECFMAAVNYRYL